MFRRIEQGQIPGTTRELNDGWGLTRGESSRLTVAGSHFALLDAEVHHRAAITLPRARCRSCSRAGADPSRVSAQDDCGVFLETLCPEGDAGCPTQDDGYEVVMPEPFQEGNGYRVRISEVDGDSVRCSDDFYLTTSDTGESPAFITVLTPDDSSVALAGGEYTIEVGSSKTPQGPPGVSCGSCHDKESNSTRKVPAGYEPCDLGKCKCRGSRSFPDRVRWER